MADVNGADGQSAVQGSSSQGQQEPSFCAMPAQDSSCSEEGVGSVSDQETEDTLSEREQPKTDASLSPEELASYRRRVMRYLRTTNIPLENVDDRRVQYLRYLQFGHSCLQARFYREMFALECKYHSKLLANYEKRRRIVVGEDEPENSGDEELPDAVATEEAAAQQGVPDFWLSVLRSSSLTASLIEPRDEPVLQRLMDIAVVMHAHHKPGFTIKFHFAPNDFFTDTVLTKVYELHFEPDCSDPLCYDGPQVCSILGCDIHWRSPDMDVTKQHGQPCRSFFNYFSNWDNALSDDDSEMDSWELDVEVGSFLRESAIPQAVLYFEDGPADLSSNDDHYSVSSSRSSDWEYQMQHHAEGDHA